MPPLLQECAAARIEAAESVSPLGTVQIFDVRGVEV